MGATQDELEWVGDQAGAGRAHQGRVPVSVNLVVVIEMGQLRGKGWGQGGQCHPSEQDISEFTRGVCVGRSPIQMY